MSFRCLLLMSVVVFCGCGGEEPFRKSTSPVKGKVTVDGVAPGAVIQIQCNPVGGLDPAHPTASSTETDPEGNFQIATYNSGDGVPAGEYTLTFAWQEFNLLSRQYSGPDKLNDRYSDPATSTIKLTVKEGEELDMGVIALTTN